MLTKEQIKHLNSISDYGKFIHRNTNKIYVSPTEYLIGVEFKNKQFLYNLPKETKIECFELLENGNIDNNKLTIPLTELKIITSIIRKDFDEIFYVEN